jgi:hypothetical protein
MMPEVFWAWVDDDGEGIIAMPDPTRPKTIVPLVHTDAEGLKHENILNYLKDTSERINKPCYLVRYRLEAIEVTVPTEERKH